MARKAKKTPEERQIEHFRAECDKYAAAFAEGAKLHSLMKLLCDKDPVGIGRPMPKDEYENEAKEMLRKLKGCPRDRAEKVVRKILVTAFTKELVRNPASDVSTPAWSIANR